MSRSLNCGKPSLVVGEKDGFARFMVHLSAASTSPVTVSYGDANQTALNGSDYTAVAGTLTFNPGVTDLVVSVPIIDDATVEGKEDFLFNLAGATGATIGNTSAIATIIDNDDGDEPVDPPEDWAAADQIAEEPDGESLDEKLAAEEPDV